MRKIIAAVAALLMLCLAGCSVEVDSPFSPPAEKAERNVTDDAHIEDLAFELWWGELTYTEQQETCDSYNVIPESMLRTLASDHNLDPDRWLANMEGVCS